MRIHVYWCERGVAVCVNKCIHVYLCEGGAAVRIYMYTFNWLYANILVRGRGGSMYTCVRGEVAARIQST